MEIAELKGTYVLAVSGGVDSATLLDLLANQSRTNPALKLVVAHFNHGIRQDAKLDEQLVSQLAKKHQLSFHSASVKLGAAASEQQAREARYNFLDHLVKKLEADGLITAHHEDDVIETAVINLIRGTGRKGLTSLSSSNHRLRPLLKYRKDDIIKYALKHQLTWREDSTNQDDRYLRNYVRHNLIPLIDEPTRQKLTELIDRQRALNTQIDETLSRILASQAKLGQMPRLWLSSLDNELSREILAAWLRQNQLASFDRPTIERLSTQLKVARAGKSFDVYGGWRIKASNRDLALYHQER